MSKYKVRLNYKLKGEGTPQPITYVDADNQEEANALAVKKTLVKVEHLIVEKC